MAESDFSGTFVFCQKRRKRAKKIRNFQNYENFRKKYFSFFCELRHSKQEKAINFFENWVRLLGLSEVFGIFLKVASLLFSDFLHEVRGI